MEQNKDIFKWVEPLKTEWITDQIDDTAVSWANSFGIYLADGIKRDKSNEPIPEKDGYGVPKTNFNNLTNKREPVYERQKALSTSQLRKFFGEIRRIQADLQQHEYFNKQDLILLKPKLAYQVGREKDKLKDAKIRDFYKQISEAIDAVTTKEHFKRFVKLVEAIVAYHKEAESQNSNQNED
jgi:CRISPR-associated protein Csm2